MLQSITHTPRSQVPLVQAARHAVLSGVSIGIPGASAASAVGWHRPVTPAEVHQPSAHTWSPAQSDGPEHCTVQSRSLGL